MKKANSVTRVQAGMTGPQAMNTAPSAPGARHIAGFGAGKTATGNAGTSGPGTPNPNHRAQAGSYNSPNDSPRCAPLSGGPGRSGPSWSQGGTSSPTKKPGPSGPGLSGTMYPPIG